MRPWQAAVKRGIDLVLATLGAVVLLPVAALCAMAVVIDSEGPVLHRARRVGRQGREFTMLKFRTMATGAHRAGPAVTGAWDGRVTRVGAFLRRTKLDELPQLLNVIAGQMSLIGPRPEAPEFVARWTEEERAILALRPGITGPAQVVYVDEEEQLVGPVDEVYERDVMHAKLAIDLDYLEGYSLRRDLAILWRTLTAVLRSPRGAGGRGGRVPSLGQRLTTINPAWFAVDLVLAATAAAGALWLRHDTLDPIAAVSRYWVFVPLAALVRPAGMVLAGAHLRIWRYPALSDVALVLWALVGGSVFMALFIFAILQPADVRGALGFPRSALLIELILSVGLIGGARLFSRIRQRPLDPRVPVAAGPPRPVLIYGAGEAGARLAREMRRNRLLRLEPIGFVDDDPGKAGLRIYGVEVIGKSTDIPTIAAAGDVEELIVAQPRIAGDRVRRLMALCSAADLPVRILPGVGELLDDSVTVGKLRPVQLEDLLRREPHEIPEEPMRELVAGRVVLVTGAGGSIGAELCRQVAALGARRLVLFERAETPLFLIDDELRHRHPRLEIVSVLGDITDARGVGRTFGRERIDVVFHAAAYKHVPLSETNASATVLTNVRGTRIVAEAAIVAGCERFIFISTDKAVDPSSVMGATKRVGERLVHELDGAGRCRFIVVRFGNVLGSQGSVVELWRQQIAMGGPVLVTHPEMNRFFMTIPEAVRLILLAGAIGRPGDVHVLNMGQPIRIVDLARDLIRMSLPAGEAEVQIQFSGLRPGEKLEEVLFAEDEVPATTDYEFLLIARPRDPSAPYHAREDALELERVAEAGDEVAVRARLLAPPARDERSLAAPA